LQGDFDYNGTVNVADLGDPATNFGRSLAGASGIRFTTFAILVIVVGCGERI